MRVSVGPQSPFPVQRAEVELAVPSYLVTRSEAGLTLVPEPAVRQWCRVAAGPAASLGQALAPGLRPAIRSAFRPRNRGRVCWTRAVFSAVEADSLARENK